MFALALVSVLLTQAAPVPHRPVATYSIVARDPATGDLGVADAIIASDYVEHIPLPPGLTPDLEGFKRFVVRWRTAVPDRLHVALPLIKRRREHGQAERRDPHGAQNGFQRIPTKRRASGHAPVP